MSSQGSETIQSVLLIQIYAAADYYTTNRTLMEQVPPVFVDIILDPYVVNIFPESLIPTGCYLIIVSIISWYLAKLIAKWLQMVARTDSSKKDEWARELHGVKFTSTQSRRRAAPFCLSTEHWRMDCNLCWIQRSPMKSTDIRTRLPVLVPASPCSWLEKVLPELGTLQ